MSAELETDAGQAGEIAEGRARPGRHGRPGAAGAAWAADVARARNGSRKPNRLAAFIFQLLAAIGFGISIALVVPTLGASALAAPGGLLLAGGRIAGMAGTYLLLVTIAIVGRIPALERAVGQDRLVGWHRVLGPWILILLGAHAVLLTFGYALGVKTGALHELVVLIMTFPGMLAAAAGLGLLVLAGVTSYRYARRKMRYETWWAVHLYTYLAAAISLWHQFATGTPFVGHPVAIAWWAALWALTAGVVLVYRVGLPLVRSNRHRLKVVSIEEEAPGVVSVICKGRHLDRLPVSGGQFMQWRFLVSGMWWQAHPYSLSAMPTANRIRITVKSLGDHSRSLAELEPGTPVAIEGPYGAFTKHVRKSDRILLVGAGVGATPIRALLDDLPRHVDTTVILRGRHERELVLRDEIAQVVGERAGRLHEVVGPREQAPLDVHHLRRLVPDVAERDVYVCGPGSFMTSFISAAREAGVPEDRIHYEDFSF